MKKYSVFLFFFLFLSLSAQINVRIHRPPPSRMEVEKLWWVDLTNPTSTTYQVYLELTITETKAGEVFRANSNTLSLPSGTSRIRPSDIKEITNVRYNAEYRDYIVRTGKIPPGNYQICIRVFQVRTNVLLGSNCYSASVAEPEAPRLITPRDGYTIKGRSITFSWTPSAPLPSGVRPSYTLIIVEVLKGQTPMEAIASNRPVFKKENIKGTSFTYTFRTRFFIQNKTFAWQVRAYDQNGFELGKNRGRSQVWTFNTEKPSGTSLPRTMKIGEFIVSNITYDGSSTLNSLSGSGETYVIQTIRNYTNPAAPPIIAVQYKFNVSFSNLKGTQSSPDTITVTEGEIVKDFSPPARVEVYGYPVLLHRVHLWPDSANVTLSVSPTCLASDTGCGGFKFGPFKQKTKPLIEFYRELTPADVPVFVLSGTGIKVRADGELKIDLERRVTPDVGITLLSGHTIENPEMDTSNTGYLYGEYRFTNAVIRPEGFSANMTLSKPWAFVSLEPIGFKVELYNGELTIMNCRVTGARFYEGKVYLPEGENGVSDGKGGKSVASYDTLIVDTTLSISGKLKSLSRIAWGGFELAWTEGNFRLIAGPIEFKPPVSGDTFHGYTGIDTLPGLSIRLKNKDTLIVHSPDSRKPIRFTGHYMCGWMNIGMQGVTGEYNRMREYYPPQEEELGIPGTPGYAAKTSFDAVLGTDLGNRKDTTLNLLFQFAGNSAFNSDLGGYFRIPYPVGSKDSSTAFPFRKLGVTSTASFVGGLVAFKDTIQLDYWGVGISSERGITSIKMGEIIYTNAEIYEPVHFSKGFNIIWGEMLADGNIGRFYFNQNSANQKFDGFYITLDSAALSSYDPSKPGELVVKCGVYIKFFGQPDRMITIHDAKYNKSDPPYYGRYVKIDPKKFMLKRDWGSGLSDMKFQEVGYDEEDQNGFRGTGTPEISLFSSSPIYSKITVDSSIIQICMSSSEHHPLVLPPSNNTTTFGSLWGCATIESDELKRIVIGGRIEATEGLILVASGGGSVEAKMVVTPTMVMFRAAGIMFLDVTGIGNVELTGSVALTCDLAHATLEGEIKGNIDFSAIAAGLEADGQMNWHIEPLSYYLQGRAAVTISGFRLGGGLAGGIYLGVNAPKSKAWVLLDGSSTNRKFGVNIDNLPDKLTGVYGFGDINFDVNFGIFSGGIEIYAGVGAFLNVVGPDETIQYMVGLPLPYVVAVVGIYLHGEILWGLVSAAAWGELEIIPGVTPFAFQGTVGLEGCVLWVMCASVEVTAGFSSSQGFYIE